MGRKWGFILMAIATAMLIWLPAGAEHTETSGTAEPGAEAEIVESSEAVKMMADDDPADTVEESEAETVESSEAVKMMADDDPADTLEESEAEAAAAENGDAGGTNGTESREERVPAAVSVRTESDQAQAGQVVDVQVQAGAGATEVSYTLARNGETVFAGKADSHFESAFRPRSEGTYTLNAEVQFEDGHKESDAVTIQVSGTAEEQQGPETIYSQKDGWWKDKKYAKTELDNAGCAIFSLSHALQRIGWSGEEIAPENLAVTFKNCYTKNGTAVARLIHYASQTFGFTTKNNLLHDKSELREGLKNGDYYSFSIVIGHIALMTGIDEMAGKVRVVDSAPSATFERIKKAKVYYLQDGQYVEAKEPGEIPGAKYYFETGYYGGLEYYLDLDYCAKRGGRLIRPTWVYYMGPEGKIGATMVEIGSGESEITVNGKPQTALTRELRWGESETPKMAIPTGKKAIKLLNASGKRIGSVARCTIVPVLQEEEDRVLVMSGEQRGYLMKKEIEVLDAMAGEILRGTISMNGSTSGRATVRLRFGPSEKESIVENWKTGTQVVLIRKENDFWLVEAKGMRAWVHQDFVTAEDGAAEKTAAQQTDTAENADSAAPTDP